jgi:transcription elongation factor Elf1
MNKPTKQRTPIKKVSDNRKKQNAEYLKIRAQFLKENPKCKVCGKDANQIHHAKGRISTLLSDLKHFISVCGLCHTKIELNPLWAKENGYSVNRTTND